MQTLVSAWLDDALSGVLRWYTAWHVAHCPRCTDAVPVLRALQTRLRRIAGLPPDPVLAPERRAAVEAAWQQVDQPSSGPPSS